MLEQLKAVWFNVVFVFGLAILTMSVVSLVVGEEPVKTQDVKTIPGEVTATKVTRIDVVDKDGKTVAAIYDDKGPKLWVKTAKGGRAIPLDTMAEKLSRFLD